MSGCFLKQKRKNTRFPEQNGELVAWGRIELPTRGFSIRCSTN